MFIFDEQIVECLHGPLRISGGFSDTFADKELLELAFTDKIQNPD